MVAAREAVREAVHESLTAAHMAEREAASAQERELRGALELKHASELSAVRSGCDEELAAQGIAARARTRALRRCAAGR